MTDPALSFGAALPPDASEASPEEPPAWTLARWTLPRHGFARDAVVTVDLNDPGVKYEIASGWLSVLDAADQPKISTDEAGQPRREDA